MSGKLLTAKSVREMFDDASQMTLWRWLKRHELGFPQPIYINGRRYFDSDEIEAFKTRAARKSLSESAVGA